MSTLVLIPARAGSVGVSRKSLQLVAGEPLVAHAIDVANAWSMTRGDVWVKVSTDCPHITALALRKAREGRYPMAVEARPPELAGGDVPLQDVARYAISPDYKIDAVVVLEPTALGVTVADLDGLHDTLTSPAGFGCVSLVEEHYRQTWNHDGRLTPYVNRQQRVMSNMLYSDVGVVAMTRSWAFGNKLAGETMLLSQGEMIDVDSYEDLAIADLRARRHLIWLRVIGAPETGTGHVQRCLRLADALRRIHDVAVDVIDGATWAQEVFTGRGLHPLGDRSPDVIVSDCLDAWREYEHTTAPLVVLEPVEYDRYNHWSTQRGSQVVIVDELAGGGVTGAWREGPRWAVLREEFAALPAQRKSYAEKMMRVVITCGGSDPGGLGQRIAANPALAGKNVRLIRGPAAAPLARPLDQQYTLVENADMASELWEADLVICTRGRTQYEAARAGAPTIAIAANGREETHARVPGVFGMCALSTDAELAHAIGLVAPVWVRSDAGMRARNAVDDRGVDRLVHLIDGMAQGLM